MKSFNNLDDESMIADANQQNVNHLLFGLNSLSSILESNAESSDGDNSKINIENTNRSSQILLNSSIISHSATISQEQQIQNPPIAPIFKTKNKFASSFDK